MWNFKHPSKALIDTSGRLKGRKIVLAVTGSIALVKAPEIARDLMRLGAEVYPVMSPSAQKMLNPMVLEWATGNKPVTEITGKIENIAAVLRLPEGNPVDLVLIAPATANTIAKLAHGINDTAVTAFSLAAQGAGIPVLVAPAMHQQLLTSKIVEENLRKIKELGFEVVEPRIEEEKAKLADVEIIVEAVVRRLTSKTLARLKFLVTAGPTIEPLDPIRHISNRSSGRMGVALAAEALRRGANVTLVYGPGTVKPPPNLKVIRVKTSKEMFNTVIGELKKDKYDVLISAAAVADYAPTEPFPVKISTEKNKELKITLKATSKLVNEVKRVSPETFLVIFKAEYNIPEEELIKKSLEKLRSCGANLAVANDIAKPETGFQQEKIEAILVDENGEIEKISKTSKAEAACKILDVISEKIK
jgi:phosphopantothenoylcysteine decarboxylase/phosphopantothenate--cysteine ligase